MAPDRLVVAVLSRQLTLSGFEQEPGELCEPVLDTDQRISQNTAVL